MQSFFSVRVMVACAALEGVKVGLKRVVRRRPKLRRCADFISDVMLPNTYFGPVIGTLSHDVHMPDGVHRAFAFAFMHARGLQEHECCMRSREAETHPADRG